MSSGDILSYDQYSEIEQRGFELPFIVEVQQPSQHLLFYGSEHTNDPKHPQFQDIEERWNDFVGNTANPIALVEGRFDEVLADFRPTKITKYLKDIENSSK